MVEYVDPPVGWFVLDVMRQDEKERSMGEWAALMVDVEPRDLKNCTVEFPVLFYVHPREYRPGVRIAHQCWARIAGQHRSRTAAWNALQDIIATRH
jgi:hypothetical protein